ncbi:hypothetical protein ATK36_4737 [Amycolatopsis sulphurea]|uniref:Uncharacterized protein n=1 Tax=Amycolatopsis sulphurea TaxID=76022 RepID=A0A2A9FEJ0_9PSEU|nr:hypothetical protein ATK36_4737 [Amycolatopsis sulphurea]
MTGFRYTRCRLNRFSGNLLPGNECCRTCTPHPLPARLATNPVAPGPVITVGADSGDRYPPEGGRQGLRFSIAWKGLADHGDR